MSLGAIIISADFLCPEEKPCFPKAKTLEVMMRLRPVRRYETRKAIQSVLSAFDDVYFLNGLQFLNLTAVTEAP